VAIHTKEVEITKSARGWSVHTIQHWKDRPNPAHTHSGAHSLTWAIYEAANWAGNNNTAIVRLTVKGEAYPRVKIEAAVKKHASGGLEYTRKSSLSALAMRESQRGITSLGRYELWTEKN